MSQADVLLGPVDVLANDRRVGGLVFESAAQPCKLHRRVLEPLADLVTLGPGEVDFDLVGVPGAKLNPTVAQLLEP